MGLHQQNQSLESFKQFGLILIKKVCWNSKCLLHETEWGRCLLHETEWKTPWWSYLTALCSLTEGFWFQILLYTAPIYLLSKRVVIKNIAVNIKLIVLKIFCRIWHFDFSCRVWHFQLCKQCGVIGLHL